MENKEVSMDLIWNQFDEMVHMIHPFVDKQSYRIHFHFVLIDKVKENINHKSIIHINHSNIIVFHCHRLFYRL